MPDIAHKIYHYLSPGGWLILVLIFSSLWMWALIFERMLFFRRLMRDDIEMAEVLDIVVGIVPPAEKQGLRSLVVRHFTDLRSGNPELDRRWLEQCILRFRPMLRFSLPLIATLAAAAPLLGLLGTVTGMITTFDVISVFGTGNAKAMAGGISTALITTQCGLVVAIPGLLMSIYIQRTASLLDQRLTELHLTMKRRLTK